PGSAMVRHHLCRHLFTMRRFASATNSGDVLRVDHLHAGPAGEDGLTQQAAEQRGALDALWRHLQGLAVDDAPRDVDAVTREDPSQVAPRVLQAVADRL